MKKSSEAIGGTNNVRVTVGENDMLANDSAPVGFSGKGCEERWDASEPSNVLVTSATFSFVFTLSIVGEKDSMAFFKISVAVISRGAHKLNVDVEPESSIVLLGSLDLSHEKLSELEI